MIRISTESLLPFLYTGLGILAVGSAYLLVESFKVRKQRAHTVVGKLVTTLIILLIVELYSLGIVSYAYIYYYPNGIYVLLPLVGLWIVCIAYATLAVRSARNRYN